MARCSPSGFLFFLLRLRFLEGELSIFSGTIGGGPVRLRIGREDAGKAGGSSEVRSCRAGEIGGDRRRDLGDAMDDEVPTSDGTAR